MSRAFGILKVILLVLLCVLIVAGAAVAAYLYADRRPETFGGRAEVLYEGGEVSLTSEAERQIATQRALLLSASTLGPIAERFGLPLDDLDEHVSVESVDDSNVLRLTAEDADPELAVAVAQAVAEGYVGQVRGADSPELEAARGLIESRIDELEGQLSKLQEQFNTARPQAGARQSTVRESQMLAESQSLLGRIGSLQERLTELELQQITDARARILTPAYLLDEPLEPQPLRAGAGGAIAGLFVACLALLVVGRLRQPA